MNNKIKVWVAVEPSGDIFTGAVDITQEMCWHRLMAVLGLPAKQREEQGWTVQPYTLAKGHDHD